MTPNLADALRAYQQASSAIEAAYEKKAEIDQQALLAEEHIRDCHVAFHKAGQYLKLAAIAEPVDEPT